MIDTDERARIIYEELTTYKHADPVAWLAEALRQFQRETEQAILSMSDCELLIRRFPKPLDVESVAEPLYLERKIELMPMAEKEQGEQR